MPHRFELGEHVALAFGFPDQDASGLYEVVALLPTRPGGEPQYRIKGSDDRERVIGEDQIYGPNSSGGPRRHPISQNPITKELDRLREDRPDNDQPTPRPVQTADNLYGAPVFDPGGRRIGSVVQIRGTGRALLVTVEVGGFFGIASRSVALTASEIVFSKGDDGHIRADTTLTKETLRDRATHHEM